jgi:hypothetical protein
MFRVSAHAEGGTNGELVQFELVVKSFLSDAVFRSKKRNHQMKQLAKIIAVHFRCGPEGFEEDHVARIIPIATATVNILVAKI